MISGEKNDQDPNLEAKLIQLLDNCRCLLRIVLEFCSLTDHFYWNVLPRKCPYLESFSMKKSRPTAALNLDFLFKFTFLKVIRLDHPAANKLVKRVCQQLKFLYMFVFQYDEHRECFIQKGQNSFYLRIDSELFFTLKMLMI